MPSLPIPMISALILGYLCIQALTRRNTNIFLTALIGLTALQGLIISLGQHYGIGFFLTIQPITAIMIPPMAWVAFQSTAIRDFELKHDIIHIVPVILIGIFVISFEDLLNTQSVFIGLDFLIPVIFIAYAIAILAIASRGADALPRLRLEASDNPVNIWRIIAATLIGSAFTDIIIVMLIMADLTYIQPWIITIYTTLMLFLIGSLSLSQNLSNPIKVINDTQAPTLPTERDEDIMLRLNQLMKEQKIYLDPDLTLDKISRRLIIPVKQVSIAINRSTGGNVSRHINKFRIDVASKALLDGENVTSAMLTSGFNTKSNFNREFLRVTGLSPSAWLKKQAS